MYPAEILNLFPPFAHTNEVFVAMSFDRRFDPVWEDVFKPAIAAVSIDEKALVPHRVDLSRKSDSIVTEIVQRLAQCRLVLADVSTTGWIGSWPGKRRAVRNSNVMYELGIAHASRLPEEVVVVRGDTDVLDFDIAGVRVHSYPSDRKSAQSVIQTLLADALKSVDQRRNFAVKRALDTLDPQMYWILHGLHEIAHPTITTMGEALASLERLGAIHRLLAGGMLQAIFGPLPDNFMDRPVAELVRYRQTQFGRAVYRAGRSAMGFNEAFGKWIATDSGKKWLAEQSAAKTPPS